MASIDEKAPSTRRLMRGVSLARMLWEGRVESRQDRTRFLRLIAVSGAETVELHKLGIDESITIGRAKDCGIQLDALAISRHHAQIEFDQAGGVLRDLSSENGVKVNRIPVRGRTILRDGDRIRLGRQDIHVEMDEQSDVVTESELLRRAVKDGLTGVLRDRAFARALEREFNEALRAERAMSLVLVDIENLDEIANEHGHKLADKVLRRTAQICEKAAYDPAGIVGRAEPDVFGIVLAYGDESDAARIGMRIENSLSVLADELGVAITTDLRSAALDPVSHRHAADLVTATSGSAAGSPEGVDS